MNGIAGVIAALGIFLVRQYASELLLPSATSVVEGFFMPVVQGTGKKGVPVCGMWEAISPVLSLCLSSIAIILANFLLF